MGPTFAELPERPWLRPILGQILGVEAPRIGASDGEKIKRLQQPDRASLGLELQTIFKVFSPMLKIENGSP